MITKIYNTLMNRETISYLFFGVLTTIIGFGLYELLFRLGYSAAASNTGSTVAAVLFAFVTNKLWVFGSKALSLPHLCREFLSFAAGRVFTFLLETAALFILVDRLLLNQTVCKLISSVIVIILNYVISKNWVFINKNNMK